MRLQWVRDGYPFQNQNISIPINCPPKQLASAGVGYSRYDSRRHIDLTGSPLVAESNQYAGSFTVVKELDRTYAEVPIGLDMLKKDGTVVRLGYTGHFSDNTSTNAIGVKFSMPF